MRKICCSLNTSCSFAFKATALAKSVPNGFSITTRERSISWASPNMRAADKAALGGMLK